jgi:hypothetical protein
MIPINQYKNMEWLNNILAIIFYSDRITNLMINSSRKWDINYRFFMILKKILTKYLNSNNILNSLSKLINSYIYHKALKEGIDISKNYLFKHYDIIKLFKELKIKFLEIIIYGKNQYINLYKITTLDNYDERLMTDSIELNNQLEFDDSPDVLFIIDKNLNKTIIEDFNNFKQNKNLDMFINDSEIEDKIFENNNITERIQFNGIDYVLDSIIFNNNNDNNNHSLVGFSKNGKKYIYKGWNKTEFNPVNPSENNNIINCNLKKVDNFNFNYYLKENDCNLYEIDANDTECNNPNNYCFNINVRDNRDIILIYVRNDRSLEKIKKTYENYDKETNIDELIQELYKIKKLNSEQVRYELDLLGVMGDLYYNYSDDDLKYILYDTIKGHFTNTKSPLKSPLIKGSINRKLNSSISSSKSIDYKSYYAKSSRKPKRYTLNV